MRTVSLLFGTLALMACSAGLAADYADNNFRATGYRDTDGDGVRDFRDLCLRTRPGTLVGAQGCPVEPLAGPVPSAHRGLPPRLRDPRHRGRPAGHFLLGSGVEAGSVIMMATVSQGDGAVGESGRRGVHAPADAVGSCRTAAWSSRAEGKQQ